MCGIVGCFMESATIDPEKLVRSVNRLYHRGPDEQSTWISQNKTVGLGHTRLSINDIQEGHHPFFSADQSIVAIVNGEFYDYERIKQQLQQEGFSFKTTCDSEILIPLYQKYGVSCLEFLRGEFAFILWDSAKKHCFAAKDRFGIKPLYYTTKNSDLYLASEIKALLPFGLVSTWNKDAIFSSNHSIYPQESTCFKNVYALKPGHFLIAKNGNIKTQTYWDLDYPKTATPTDQYNEQEAISCFREKLDEAIAVRLKADVPVGCYLSGGIDSSAVLGLASKRHNKPMDTFTIAFDDDLFDESHIAKETAKFVGANYHEVKITDQNIVENFSNAIYHGESIVMNTHGVAMFLLSKLVNHHGYKSILTGGGADETLAGYQFFKEDRINYDYAQEPASDLSAMRHAVRQSPIGAGLVSAQSSTLKLSSNVCELVEHTPELLKIYHARGQQFSKLYNPDFLHYTQRKDAITEFLSSLNRSQLSNIRLLNTSSYLFCKSTMPGYILSSIGDRTDMAHSVESRLPFLDHKLFEFVRQLPPHMKIHGLTEKYILREAVKDVITPTLYTRTKQPFFAPPSLNSLYSLMENTFNSELLKSSPFFDQKSVLSLLHSAKKAQGKDLIIVDSLLTEILSTCILQEEFHLTP